MGFYTVSSQVFIMFFLMSLGYFATRIGMLKRETGQDITAILVTFVSPCVILYAFSQPFDGSKANALILSLVLDVLFFGGMAVVAHVVFHKRIVPDAIRRIQMQFAFVYSNNGFIGLPLSMALFGSDGVFFAAAHMAIGNLFIWSHGLRLYRSGTGEGSSLLKVVSNPNILALVLAMTLYFSQVQIPGLPLQVIGHVADLNTTLSMMVIGSSIAQMRVHSIFADVSVWIMSGVRNVLLPLAVLGVLMLLPSGFLPNLAAVVIVIMTACPVAANAVMFCKFCGLPEEYPTKLVTLSTLLSALTLPVMVMISLYVFPVM